MSQLSLYGIATEPVEDPVVDRGWKIYLGDAGNDGAHDFFFQSYCFSRVPRRPHEALEQFLVERDPVAKATYGFHGSGDTRYLLLTYHMRANLLHLVGRAQERGLRLIVRRLKEIEDLGERVDTLYDIDCEHVPMGERTGDLIRTIRYDIGNYCRRKNPLGSEPQMRKKVLASSFREVDTLQLDFGYQKSRSGAGALMLAKGNSYDICRLEIGIDISKGCVVAMAPDGWHVPANRCDYCYDMYLNGDPIQTSLFDLSVESVERGIIDKINALGFADKKRVYIRFGQRVDSMMPEAFRTRLGLPDNTSMVLEGLARVAQQRDIRTAVVTKLPEYSLQRAEQLRNARATLLVSIGWEQLEKGVLDMGFPVATRLEEARKFAEQGVPTGFFVALDMTRPFSSIQKDAQETFAFHERYRNLFGDVQGGILLLEARIRSKSHAVVIGGDSWDALRMRGQGGQGSFFHDADLGLWQVRQGSSSFLEQKTIHKDFVDLVKQRSSGLRPCLVHAKPHGCGACFMDWK